MTEKRARGESPFSALIAGAVAMIVTGVLTYIIARIFTVDPNIQTVSVGACIVIVALLVNIAQRGYTSLTDDFGKRYMNDHTGISRIYSSLNDDECKADMKAQFEKANKSRLLLQIGRRELGDGEPSYFWSLAMKKNKPGTQIMVLRATENSPFLSKERAQLRNTPVSRWKEDLRRLARQIDLLKNAYQVKILEGEHSEPFLWRLFIFDDIAFVSAYLHGSENDNKAPVYKINKGENSLYLVFDKYFDYLWRKYDGNAPEDPIEKWKDWI